MILILPEVSEAQQPAPNANRLCLTLLIDSTIVRLAVAMGGFGKVRRTPTYGGHDVLPAIPVRHQQMGGSWIHYSVGDYFTHAERRRG